MEMMGSKKEVPREPGWVNGVVRRGGKRCWSMDKDKQLSLPVLLPEHALCQEIGIYLVESSHDADARGARGGDKPLPIHINRRIVGETRASQAQSTRTDFSGFGKTRPKTCNTFASESIYIVGNVLRGDVLRGDVLRGNVLRGNVLRGDVLRGNVLRGDVL